MLLDDLSDYLTTKIANIAIQKGFFQEIPDDALALRETGGFPSQHANTPDFGPILDEPTVQVVVRSKTYQQAMATCRSVYDALNGGRDLTINDGFYHFITALQPPFFLMRDENHRFQCAFNLHVKRRSVS